MKKLLFIFLVLLFSPGGISQTKTIQIDFSTQTDTAKLNTGVNTGPHSLISGTTENCLNYIGNQLVRTHDYHGPCDYYEYTTFFNYFSQTFNYTFQSHINTNYNWTSTDAQILEIQDANMTPFFRLGISFPGGGPSPATPMPKDSDNLNFYSFAGICKRTAMHYTDSWDNGFEYPVTYWEIWNEPNNAASWDTDSITAYYRMYHQVVDSLDAFNPSLKVGGPGTAQSAFYIGGIHYTINPNYVGNFFSYCQTNNLPLDFYSFHMYDKNNPYALKILTDTLAYYLDQYGFTQTELVISETNNDNPGYNNTTKGCSYIASELISLSDSRLTNFIWYRGVDLNPLCNSDIGTTPDVTMNGYAYKFFNDLNLSTPLIISSSGNEFNNDDLKDSLNNLMILSGKNDNENLVKILISNHESVYDSITITIDNLSWLTSDVVTVQVEKVSPTAGYEISTSNTSGNSSMIIGLSDVMDETVFLITLVNTTMNSLDEPDGELFFNLVPNPASERITIQCAEIISRIEMTDLQGQLILATENTNELDVSTISAGIYLITVQSNSGFIQSQKIVIY